jgi:hypothetical protein
MAIPNSAELLISHMSRRSPNTNINPAALRLTHRRSRTADEITLLGLGLGRDSDGHRDNLDVA